MTYLVEAEMVEVVEACVEEPPSGLAGAAVGVVQQTSPAAVVALELCCRHLLELCPSQLLGWWSSSLLDRS